MKLKDEKAFTGIDITIAIMIVVIFAGLIATLFYNYNLTSKQIQRKAKATECAINTIEELKSSDFENYVNCSSNEGKDEKKGIIYKDEKIEEGYYKTVEVTDYTDISGNESKQFGIVKKVKVSISYNVEKKENKVELSTIISKEI